MVTSDQLSDLLQRFSLEPVGKLIDSSNGALVCSLDGLKVVYKPQRFESPLWDFAEGTLGLREVAASEIDAALGWDLVPTTVWSEVGPVGPGSVQVYIEDAEIVDVGIFPADQIPSDWFHILSGELEGELVDVGHSPAAELRKLAVFDAILNNADRKGGHILRGSDQHLWAIDHGVALHEEPKLRTVLWGWAEQKLDADEAADVRRFISAIDDLELAGITETERQAMVDRTMRLLAKGLPLPSRRWPAIPWPVF